MSAQLSKNIKNIEPILTAIGHTTRLHIIVTLLQLNCSGVRVGDITKYTHLSRPAVSHHLKILKSVGIINMRKEGTKNYYYLETQLPQLQQLRDVLTIIINYKGDIDNG